MKIYIFDADIDNFQAYLHSSDDDLTALSEVNGQPLASRWGRVRVVPDPDSKRREPRGDNPGLFLGSCVPALSLKAVDALRDLLEPAGELLPLECEVEPLWVFNCTRIVNLLDESASSIQRFNDGRIMWVRRHVWRLDAELETVFRIPGVRNTYATQVVADRIHSAGLRGFGLHE